MASWISDVKGVVFQLSQIGDAVPDEDIILVLTNGLPPSYNHFVLTLNSTLSEVSNLNYIIRCLQTKETCQCAQSRRLDTNGHALAITCDWPKRDLAQITCFRYGNKGHYQANCPTHPRQTGLAPPPTAPNKPMNKPVTATTTIEEGALMVEGTEDVW